MPQLKPSEAARLALSAYQVKDGGVQDAFNPLYLPPQFGLPSRVTGVSGLGPGVLSGFGFVAAGTSELTKREFIVALRGTDGHADELTDALIGSGVPGPSGKRVHMGFNRTWNSLRGQIDQRLSGQLLSGATVHCVGHSLGGALATLAADYLNGRGAQVKVYTFGSPRVGMSDFASSFTGRVTLANIFRVYHPADPVAMVPLFPFLHVPYGQSAYQLACNGAERIRGSAHKMVDSYIPLIGDKSYEALAANGAPSLTDRQIEAWLQGVKAGGWVQNYGARAVEMVGIALEWVLRQLLQGALIGLQPLLASGVTAIDTLAYVLYEGTRLVKKAAWYVEAILIAILKLAGQTARSGAELTLDFIRWVLVSLFQGISAMARSAINVF
jgi:pimeloyl-ACP methyl ester carboxylesterase